MKIDIYSPNIALSDRLREHAQRQAQAMLGRLAKRIDRVTITLEQLQSPRGIADQRCTVWVEPHGGRPLLAEHTHEHLHGAITHAMRTASRAVERRQGQRLRRAAEGHQPELRAAS